MSQMLDNFYSLFHENVAFHFPPGFHHTNRVYYRKYFKKHNSMKLLWNYFLVIVDNNQQQRIPNSYHTAPFVLHIRSVVPVIYV